MRKICKLFGVTLDPDCRRPLSGKLFEHLIMSFGSKCSSFSHLQRIEIRKLGSAGSGITQPLLPPTAAAGPRGAGAPDLTQCCTSLASREPAATLWIHTVSRGPGRSHYGEQIKPALSQLLASLFFSVNSLDLRSPSLAKRRVKRYVASSTGWGTGRERPVPSTCLCSLWSTRAE